MTSLCPWLFGCAEPPTFDDVLRGKTALEASDREAVEQLLASSSATPADIRLLPLDEDYGAEPYLKIEDGRVTRLALAEVSDVSGVESLSALRGLRLAGTFESLRMSGLDELEVLEILSWDESLRALELGSLPALRSLSIHGADLPSDLDLSDLKLQDLSLTHCGLESAPPLDPSELTDLFLSGNTLSSLSFLEGFDSLERLHLSKTGLESLDGLPTLPSLRALYWEDNPLRPDVSLDSDRVPKLVKIDLARTGLRAAPIGLRNRDGLRVEFEPGVAEALDFEATLGRLRQAQADAPGALVEKVRSTSGTIRGSSGRCTWRTGTFHRAEVNCHFAYESVRGTALVRLGETDAAMPFQGGGSPRVRATLSVVQGEVALYVKEEHDLVAIAQVITEAGDEVAERHRQPGDTFDGYRRVVARPGEPAEVQGDVVLLGSRVVLIVESVDVEARDVRLTIEPV